MNFFRKIFGLGPKDPVNTRPKTNTPEIKKEMLENTGEGKL